jgi:hypothetical protein
MNLKKILEIKDATPENLERKNKITNITLIVNALALLTIILLYQGLPKCQEVSSPMTYVTPEEFAAYQADLKEPTTPPSPRSPPEGKVIQQVQVPECPPAPLCPEVPTTVTTPPTTCPTLAIPPALAKAALNIRLPDTAPAVQDGCFKCLRKVWETLEIPGRPKFFPGPSPGNALDFYATLKGNNATSEGYLFAKQSGSNYGLSGQYHGIGYFLNGTIWETFPVNDTHIIENSSTWTDADGLNWTKYDSYVIQEETKNLWVQKR